MHSTGDHSNIKRMRTGSISGRLRTASDLEESGVIDKYQKGLIKDMIISGDVALQQSLDKCEKGDTSSLEELIKKGLFARKQSIDLLDGLDFDFLNGIKTEDDIGNIFDDDMMFDFSSEHHTMDIKKEGDKSHFPKRTSSIDSTTSANAFRIFDNMPVYRGHSFGDDSNILTDLDNLYNEEESGTRDLFFGLGHSAAPPDNIDLSAYTAHAVSLQGGTVKTAAKPSKRSGANMSGVIPLSEFARAADDSGNRRKDISSVHVKLEPGTTKGSARTGYVPPPVLSTENSDDPYNGMTFKLPANSGGVGFIGAYSPEQRRLRIEKFFEKRNRRVWTKKVKYDVRKNFADSRLRVKGRFVKKEDEDIMRELLDI